MTKIDENIDYKAITDYLYCLLDDISTTSDLAKGNDKFYREVVEKICKKRNNIIDECDGYSIKFKSDKIPLKSTKDIPFSYEF